MRGPVATLFELNNQTLKLDEAQCLINSARVTGASIQAVQLILDRQQSQLDQKRKQIEAMKRVIPRMN